MQVGSGEKRNTFRNKTVCMCSTPSLAIIFGRLFSKSCSFGSKKPALNFALVRRYQDKYAKPVPEHLKVCHI